MALNLSELAERYPALWHVTPTENWDRIERTKLLASASTLMRLAGDETWLRRKRPQPVPLLLNGDVVTLRDQSPLLEANIDLQGGWTFARLIEEINGRVYFWPGDEKRPIGAAAANYEAFRASGEFLTLRIPLERVRRRCGPFQLQLVSFNVGAPRMVSGRKAPRGPHTFAAPGAFTGGPAKVHEVVVRETLDLGAVWDDVVVE